MMRLIVLVSLVSGILSASSAFAQQGWRLETPNAPWDPRDSHNTLVFNNELWVLNGEAGVFGSPSDAWASSDGLNWNVKSADWWLAKGNAETIEFNGEMWVLGGSNTSHLWRSPDGINWTQEPDAPWLERRNFAGVAFNGKLWIFGGWTHQPPYMYPLNDVWSTTDGVNWTQEVAAANWSARSGHTAAVFNNRMWIMGGADGQIRNDVWSSADGVNWVQETANAGWGPRTSSATVVYRNRLWVMGGSFTDGLAAYEYDDAWSSTDGVNWVKETDGAPWGERTRHAAAVFKNRIWITGGAAGTIMNDVWSYGLHIAPGTLLDATVNEPYERTLKAKEGDGPFEWSIVAGGPPPGMVINISTTQDTIRIEGTPVEAGDYDFTLKLKDGNGHEMEQDFTLTVKPRQAGGSNSSSSSSGCTARSTSSRLPWLILTGAATLTAAAVRRRRRVAADP